MFDDDKAMKDELIKIANQLDPDNPDEVRGDNARHKAGKQLMQVIQDYTNIRPTRDQHVEMLRTQEDTRIQDAIREAADYGQQVVEDWREKRENLQDEYDVEITHQEREGYTVKYEGDTFSVAWPEDIVVINGDSPREYDGDVPDTVTEYIQKRMELAEEAQERFEDKMDELGFEATRHSEYVTFETSDEGMKDGMPYIKFLVGPNIPKKPVSFTIRSERTTSWMPHQIWDEFEDPAKQREDNDESDE